MAVRPFRVPEYLSAPDDMTVFRSMSEKLALVLIGLTANFGADKGVGAAHLSRTVSAPTLCPDDRR
jgi:hypothetical protein